MRSIIDATLRARHFLRPRLLGPALAGTVLIVALAGCANSSAARPPVVAAHPQATPVPTELVAYSSDALNTVTSSLGEGRQLGDQMKHDWPSDVGTLCSDMGGQISNEYDAFQSVYLPASASSISSDARTGYRTVLSAIDECGLASDDNSRAQMKTALHDLNYGLWYLGRVQALLQTWSSGH